VLRRTALFSVIVLELFLAATAISGAIWVVPSQPVALLVGSPFTDYTIPALALGLIGVAALVSAALLLVRRPIGVLGSIAVGAGIVVFELVETSVMGLNVWLHTLGLGPTVAVERFGSLEGIPSPLGVPLPLWLQPFYCVVGLLIIALALATAPIGGRAGHPDPPPIIRPLTSSQEPAR